MVATSEKNPKVCRRQHARQVNGNQQRQAQLRQRASQQNQLRHMGTAKRRKGYAVVGSGMR